MSIIVPIIEEKKKTGHDIHTMDKKYHNEKESCLQAF